VAIYKTSDAVGEREDLSDVITRIDPDETPVFSNAKKVVTKGVNTEWQVQELAAASSSNFNNEGADFSFVNPSATTRLGNVHQIFVQAASVSATLDSVDKAGRDKETAYVKLLKGIEQRRDIETTLVMSQAKSSSDPRKMGSVASYMTNVDLVSPSTTAAGTGADVSDGAGTNRALTLASIESAMKLAYNDGGSPDIMIMHPNNKVAFSNLSSGSIADQQLQYTAPRDIAIIGSVSLFLTDFGELNVVIDRFIGDEHVWLMDTDHYGVGHLPGRMFSAQEVAGTGDGSKFAIVSECTYIPDAPKAHGAVLDLSGS
jgi:hypothetical protein